MLIICDLSAAFGYGVRNRVLLSGRHSLILSPGVERTWKTIIRQECFRSEKFVTQRAQSLPIFAYGLNLGGPAITLFRVGQA